MSESLESLDLERLKRLTVAELRRLWREQFGRQARSQQQPRVRALLVRDLAWIKQQRVRGGLDRDTQRLLDAAIRRSKAESDESSEPSPLRKRTRRTQKPQLQAGVTLVRQWRGKTYRVKVVEDAEGKRRFRFAGREYRSLTVIAKEITGAHWSGPRFFGLNKVRSTG